MIPLRGHREKESIVASPIGQLRLIALEMRLAPMPFDLSFVETSVKPLLRLTFGIHGEPFFANPITSGRESVLVSNSTEKE